MFVVSVLHVGFYADQHGYVGSGLDASVGLQLVRTVRHHEDLAVAVGREGGGRRLSGGELTARKTVSNKQPTMMLGTEMTTAKVRDRTVSTTGHSVRMSKQRLVWRRGEEHSYEG